MHPRFYNCLVFICLQLLLDLQSVSSIQQWIRLIVYTACQWTLSSATHSSLLPNQSKDSFLICLNKATWVKASFKIVTPASKCSQQERLDKMQIKMCEKSGIELQITSIKRNIQQLIKHKMWLLTSVWKLIINNKSYAAFFWFNFKS